MTYTGGFAAAAATRGMTGDGRDVVARALDYPIIDVGRVVRIVARSSTTRILKSKTYG
jgi:hypothetical protein